MSTMQVNGMVDSAAATGERLIRFSKLLDKAFRMAVNSRSYLISDSAGASVDRFTLTRIERTLDGIMEARGRALLARHLLFDAINALKEVESCTVNMPFESEREKHYPLNDTGYLHIRPNVSEEEVQANAKEEQDSKV